VIGTTDLVEIEGAGRRCERGRGVVLAAARRRSDAGDLCGGGFATGGPAERALSKHTAHSASHS
jgi:hypothetical protein